MVVADALDEIDNEEYVSVLNAMMKARAKVIKEGDTYEGRAKLYRAAVSRGFESQLVSKIIRAGGLWPDDE